MSDSLTSQIGNAEPRTAATAGLQNARAPLSDLFADVFNKTTFADRMLPQSDFGSARAAERDHEVRQEAHDADRDRADAEPSDDVSADVRDADERPQDSDDANAETEQDEQPDDAGLSDAQQFSTASSPADLLALNAARHAVEKPGLSVQPNSASGVELRAKTEGPAASQARATMTRGEIQAAAQKTANTDKAIASGRDPLANANAALGNSKSATNGLQTDSAAAKAGSNVAATAGEKTQANSALVLNQSQSAANGDADGLMASFEKHASLIRAGAKRAAELHHMKIRLVVHRDAIKEAIAKNSSGPNNLTTPTAATGAPKASIEVTTSAMPPAPAALEGPAARPAALFNAPTPGTLPGQAGVTGSPSLAIGDTVGDGNEQLTTVSAGRLSMASNTTPSLSARPMPSQAAFPPAEQVKVHIQQLAKSDADRIQVKLSPASLGKVEVTLDLSPDRVVHAVVYAEKPETLDMLERDARVLQQAFEEAGMKFDQNSLTFKHGQSGGSDAELADGSGSAENGAAKDGDGSDIDETAANNQPSRRQHDGMLDLEI